MLFGGHTLYFNTILLDKTFKVVPNSPIKKRQGFEFMCGNSVERKEYKKQKRNEFFDIKRTRGGRFLSKM